MPSSTERFDPDQLAHLEEERDFLLRSIDDLDAELAAGDIEPDDHQALRDDYTRRAAEVIRAIDARTTAMQEAVPSRDWRRIGLIVAGLLVLGGIVGVVVAQSSGSRTGSDVSSGDIRQSVGQRLLEAGQLAAEGELDEAVDVYDSVLADQPSNAEALAYKGWTLYRAGDDAAATAALDEAVIADPELPDARVFRAIVAADQQDWDDAAEELAAFDASDPPPAMEELVAAQGLRGRVAAGRLQAQVADLDVVEVADLDGVTVDDVAAAGVYLVDRDPLTALKLLQAVLAVDPDNAPALTYRAVLVSSSPELAAEARADLDAAVAADPRLVDARFYRAIALAQAGEIEAAEQDLAVLDELAPVLAAEARARAGL